MITMAGTLDFLSINIWHILMAMGNLLILVLILKKFLFKPVQNIIKQREEEVKEVYSRADEALEAANAEKELYLKKLDDAKAEADSMIKTASERAKAESAEIISDAKAEAERRRRNADEDIELARKKAAEEMRDSISEMVISLAEQVVEKEIDPNVHASLIDDAIESLGENT